MVALMNSTESGQPKHMPSQTKPFGEKGRRTARRLCRIAGDLKGKNRILPFSHLVVPMIVLQETPLEKGKIKGN